MLRLDVGTKDRGSEARDMAKENEKETKNYYSYSGSLQSDKNI